MADTWAFLIQSLFHPLIQKLEVGLGEGFLQYFCLSHVGLLKRG